MDSSSGHLNKYIAFSFSGVCLLVSILITVLYLAPQNFNTNLNTPVLLASLGLNIIVIVCTMLAIRSKAFTVASLVSLHIVMGVMITLFSQTYSPYTAGWAIMIMISTMYYSWKGFFGSVLSLILTAVAVLVFMPNDDVASRYHIIRYDIGSMVPYIFMSVLVVTLTVFTAYIFVLILKSEQAKKNELAKAQMSEMMQVNRLNTLLNSISDAVVTLNRYGRITSQNASAQAFFDTNASLIGRNVDELLKLKDTDSKEVSIREITQKMTSFSLREDLSNTLPDGDTRYLSIQLSKIRGTFGDEEEYGVVLIIRDITKQKTLEEEKDEFISVTSHELRTPVAIAEGSLSNLLLMQERGVTGDKLKQSADEAHSQILYLANMINDLSTLSRAERGIGDSIETIDLTDLLNNMYTRYLPEAEAKSLHLNLDIPGSLPQIETSRLYLEEILQNFITNAVKYTKEGHVTIHAEVILENVKFSVSDTGIGLSKTDLKHIFEKFYRSEDYRTRESSGTGLGLYVVKKLADKLGTRIEVESKLNHGSTFGFMLPLRNKLVNIPHDSAKDDQPPAAPAGAE